MEWMSQAATEAPTAREQQLIVLIARGLQNKVIAHELKISANTVRAHIGNIMRKYRLHNRTQIAMVLAPRLNEPWRRPPGIEE
ncbi:MAG TPA: LuxR C-terminal-related transcriptional regulator [Pseudolabrys sp.]|nr:LuxR C-terminal-related transcriptional regulator [Pseudolabrys sp.]